MAVKRSSRGWRLPLRICVAAVTLVSVGNLTGWSVEPVSAGVEPLCVQVNNGDFNGFGSSISFRGAFVPGDTIIVRSGEPSSAPVGGVLPSTTQLLIDGTLVDSGGFPATLDHTFLDDAAHTVAYSVNDRGSNATFTATCTAGPPPTTSTTTTTTAPPSTTTTAPTTTSISPATSTTTGATTTTGSPASGATTTVVRPSAGSLPATGGRGTTTAIGIAVLALAGGAVALMLARRRTA